MKAKSDYMLRIRWIMTGFVAGLFCGGLVGVYHLFHG